MANRPKRLKFMGEFNSKGKPRQFFLNVPARDLEAADLNKLSDERIAEIQMPPYRLYVDPDVETVKESGKAKEVKADERTLADASA